MSGTPTQRTLQRLRKEGWTAAVTERWNHFSKVRQDLFGFCDVIAVKPGQGVLMVQCTSTANKSARVKKIQSLPAAVVCLEAGCRVEAWGWAKRGARGKAKKWTLSVSVLVCQEGEVLEVDV